MKIKVFQKGFNYSQDGQGNRLVYHLWGCNFYCPWCANPEGMNISDSTYEEYEIDEIINEAVSSKAMFFDGGGVTLTGGEPSNQFDAIKNLYSKLKDAGINTALETNGAHERLCELFPLVDELIIDLKHYNNATHEAYTKSGNATVISNIKKAQKYRNQLLLRITLVNGFNADESDIKHFINLIKSFDFPGLTLELLAYHEYGKGKWAEHGKKYTFKDGFVSAEVLTEFQKQLNANGIRSVKT